MTRQENILTLTEHLEHWKRLLSEKICDQSEGEKTIDALRNAIKALEQETCDDAISRSATLDAIIKRLGIKNETYLLEAERVIYQQILAMPPVTPQPKMGQWIRVDKNKLRCSGCEVIHLIAQYPYGKIGWCPNCGAKMSEVEK